MVEVGPQPEEACDTGKRFGIHAVVDGSIMAAGEQFHHGLMNTSDSMMNVYILLCCISLFCQLF